MEPVVDPRPPVAIPQEALFLGNISINGKIKPVHVLVTQGDQNLAITATADQLNQLFQAVIATHTFAPTDDVKGANEIGIQYTKEEGLLETKQHDTDVDTLTTWGAFREAVLGQPEEPPGARSPSATGLSPRSSPFTVRVDASTPTNVAKRKQLQSLRRRLKRQQESLTGETSRKVVTAIKTPGDIGPKYNPRVRARLEALESSDDEDDFSTDQLTGPPKREEFSARTRQLLNLAELT